jgi:N-acetylglucosaminyldiphosphoundecaprenol N-acetyl-beta-D-mannosaminyltransferase
MLDRPDDRGDLLVAARARADEPSISLVPPGQPLSRSIIGMRVDAVSYEDATERILDWARTGESRSICVASVNNAILARADDGFRRAVNESDLVTPDGMPLVWGLRLLGVPSAQRVCGPVLTPMLFEAASQRGIPVGFYGGVPDVLDDLVRQVSERFRRLDVAYAWSPPFRPLSVAEDEQVVAEIRGSGARILFVGLGAPKQELWMARHRGAIASVMVGVGAAFDLLAGRTTRAPLWMQRSGLEWVHRLLHEPRRLWKRYLYGNPKFVALVGKQVLQAKLNPHGRRSQAGARPKTTKGGT